MLERVDHNSYRDDSHTFSRGHLTPCGDFDERALKVQTFMTTNIAPQVQETFNDGVWNDLEMRVRTLPDTFKKGFTVLTGVVHDMQDHAMKLNHRVSIPTHFYKIIIDETTYPLERSSISAFLMENRRYSSTETDPCGYRVPVKTIEELTGMDFLISMPEERRQALTNLTGTLKGLCPPLSH